MADRVEVAKAVEYAVLGVPAGKVAAAKIVAYVILEPGEDGSSPSSPKQGYCWAQTVGNS
jgi:hypothetical protein